MAASTNKSPFSYMVMVAYNRLFAIYYNFISASDSSKTTLFPPEYKHLLAYATPQNDSAKMRGLLFS